MASSMLSLLFPLVLSMVSKQGIHCLYFCCEVILLPICINLTLCSSLLKEKASFVASLLNLQGYFRRHNFKSCLRKLVIKLHVLVSPTIHRRTANLHKPFLTDTPRKLSTCAKTTLDLPKVSKGTRYTVDHSSLK